ncbi:DMT family transporter [Rhodobacter capsulatus]|jgi:drug/metabolite transporter (DMT)-like permease|uniref:Transporter, dme family n=1 Tax=Rhodobacter capsulatus (strain ATCC BAA-309 / NBRC 16581 / SB1003) TaxID=272942 RepID=D5APE9_RHOCB|nr:DMT family transporter [Rhodobacter capsulatus]ADE84521.1 transporter, dme family [Rhodobacter capsulatus SB 1003]ETD02849.1 membrane protein [Rhodobacter capsulatus DE442]ETD79005.1 membrane protein [Rhodobacter capsulatus R121]ETE54751.1 membrane protein [Rhodobacter capsulatus Y262]MDS0926267.1 DMT family transporter [Rhodobacter capsulatus]
MSHQDRILPGILLMLGFCIIAPLIDVASKLAAQAVPVGTVTLGRYVAQLLLMVPIVALLGHPWGMSRRALALTFARAAVSVLSTYSFVAAVQHMPIADALAIAFVEPFVILFIGRFVMHEEVGPRRIAASVVGFIGALFVIQPSFAVFGVVALYPLGTAVGFALYILLTRALSRHMHPVPMNLHTAWAAIVILIPILALGGQFDIGQVRFETPEGIFWLWCFCVGLASTVSHMSMSYALKYAPSSTLAPLHYFEMLTATLFGYLVFGDFPNALTWVGIGIITASGLYIIHRERLAAKARAARG